MIGITKFFPSLKSFRDSYQDSMLFVISARNEAKVKQIVKKNDEVIVVHGEPKVANLPLTPKAYECDLVVGIGGGSVIDWAKYTYVQQNKIQLTTGRNQVLQMNRKPRLGGLIVIPTLLGSGAEWSSSCPIVHGGHKMYLSDPNLTPLTVNVANMCQQNYNERQFKNQIADIFSHLFESLFSRRIHNFDYELLSGLLQEMKRKIKLREKFDFTNLYMLNHYASLAQDKYLVGPAHALAHTHYYHLGHANAVALSMYIVYSKEEYSEILKSIGFSNDFFMTFWLDYFEIDTSDITEIPNWDMVKKDLCMTFSKLR